MTNMHCLLAYIDAACLCCVHEQPTRTWYDVLAESQARKAAQAPPSHVVRISNVVNTDELQDNESYAEVIEVHISYCLN
jgi:hypothetical protein